MDEIDEITDHIQQAAGSSADVIWGYCKDESLGDRVRITIIATGFQTSPEALGANADHSTRTIIPLSAEVPTIITQPIVNPVEASLPKAKAPEPTPSEPFVPEPYLRTVETKVEPAPVVNTAAQPPQRTIEFEVERKVLSGVPGPTSTPAPEKRTFDLYEPPTASTPPAPPAPVNEPRTEINEARLSQAEHQNRVEQRVAKVRELNQRLRTPNGLSDLEREPAYKRKNIQLNDSTQSTDSSVSRYTLSEETDENGERRVELKRNNPYLHDNVD